MAGTAHRPDPFVADLQCMQVGIPAKIIAAQGQVDTAAGEVDRPAGRHQVQVNIRVGGMKGRQPWDQPAHGDGRFARQHQYVLSRLLLQAVHRAFKLLEHRQGGAVQGAPGGGEKDRPVAPLEQLHPQRLFQQAYLPAHGAVGDIEQLGGAHETLGLRGNVEIAKGGQCRQFHICEKN
ncbi:hypothetical protein D3C79_735700 [compost metagenome]